MVVLALSTGARKMELLSFRWSDVDLPRGIITLHETKNRNRRALHLTGHALGLMRQYAKVRRINTDLIFPNQAGTAPASIREARITARRKANIADFRFHDLRHTATSYLVMSGASLAMVGRYAYLSEQHMARVAARMNATIFGDT